MSQNMYHWEALRKQQVVDRKYAALKRLEEKKVCTPILFSGVFINMSATHNVVSGAVDVYTKADFDRCPSAFTMMKHNYFIILY